MIKAVQPQTQNAPIFGNNLNAIQKNLASLPLPKAQEDEFIFSGTINKNAYETLKDLFASKVVGPATAALGIIRKGASYHIKGITAFPDNGGVPKISYIKLGTEGIESKSLSIHAPETEFGRLMGEVTDENAIEELERFIV